MAFSDEKQLAAHAAGDHAVGEHHGIIPVACPSERADMWHAWSLLLPLALNSFDSITEICTVAALV